VTVADEPSSPGPFDARMIRQLASLMSRHDLSEVELTEGDRRLRLRRGPRGQVVAVQSAPAAVPTAQPAPTPAPAAAQAALQKPARSLIDVKSPGPGTFYSREKPDAQPYVAVGSRVLPNTVVGLIEAMKLFNEITADCSGVVAEVLVEDKQTIEYGQVLMRVDPAG
jgi:acetyl-CoA carboxylase biotin carboxyl carrier protein